MTKSPGIREPFNALSHLVGAVLTVVGAAVLVALHLDHPAAWAGFLVFGLSAAFLYIASSVYHWTPKPIPALQKLDHTAIYVMIAGCYTPICLLALQSAGLWVLAAQWGLALVGVILTLTMAKPPTWVRLTLYLAMGWMAIPFLGSILAAGGVGLAAWMLAGGVCYTVGVIFYAGRRPILWPGVFSSHEIWHLFVMAGTACHFMMMLSMPSQA
ncbi:MAG: hemolysin III family protein [Fimbriimonadaceae bacterium]|nr:hemolysin III family protein [Fimbriimonadaceae bacterium]